jgi:chloramphenicol-sensitive protein RarD
MLRRNSCAGTIASPGNIRNLALPSHRTLTLPKTGSPNTIEDRGGLLYGIGAYTLWGVFPLYFRALSEVPPLTILCHRIVWSALLLAVVVSARREWSAIWPVLRSPRQILLLTTGSVLIALNWLIFIYSISTRQVLQASLGYFINPLFSIALGMIFLRERLRAWQWLAVIIAAAAVANQAVRGGEFPWIAVSLAVSFGLYGLVRKKIDVNSLHALLVETSLLVPLSFLALALLPASHFSRMSWSLLSLSGIVTAIPLLLFGAAVRRLRLSTMGFLQYVGPSLQFLVATVAFGEHIDRAKMISFILCWIAIGIYIFDSVLRRSSPIVADEPE